ncbi:proline-rich domain-containing protein [uncultured Clostridium sp.]|uniref:proline-rich domain-containing protein n=2 Tax=Clostridium TaxID=1485 RepID=UPI0026735926|nr:proline-rich domain-containing protein [uncultured Clostridium sp.]
MSTKEKKLAIALAGGLIISNLGVVTASANTNVLKEALVEQNKQNNFPTITQQTIKFDNNNSKDLVITGVDYFNQKLTKFTISYGENRYELNVDKLVYNDSEKTLTIPYEELKALNLTNGMYPCVLMFSDQTLSVGAITINVINSNTSINKPNVPELPPSNGGEEVKPPSNGGEEVKPPSNGGEEVKPPSNEGEEVKPPSNEGEEVKPPSNEGEEVKPPSNGGEEVKPPSNEGEEVKPPSNDTQFEVTIDKNNLKAVEIPNFIPSNSKVEYVTINGKKLPVIYKNLRSKEDISSAPAVYIIDDKLVLSPEVLEYIGFESSNYDINLVLEDGSIVSKTIKLDMKNDTEKPVEQQKPVAPSEDKENEKNPSSDNKNESLVGSSNDSSKLPQTGYVVTSGLIGTIITGIGAILINKKK